MLLREVILVVTVVMSVSFIGTATLLIAIKDIKQIDGEGWTSYDEDL